MDEILPSYPLDKNITKFTSIRLETFAILNVIHIRKYRIKWNDERSDRASTELEIMEEF